MRFVPDHLKTREMCNRDVKKDSYQQGYFPNQLKTQGMCEKAVEDEPKALEFVPDCFKTQGMCERALEKDPYQLENVPDHLKAQSMCEKAVENDPGLQKTPPFLALVPDHLKTQEMCGNAVRYYLYSLEHVPDWFVTQGQLKLWYDDEGLIKWYDGYKERKTQKASIKEEVLPITWHPSRYWILGLVYVIR